MSETQLLPISNCDRSDCEGDIIFVHGLGGHARGAWHPDGKRDNDDFWPVWLGEDLPSLKVWSLDYAIEPFRWKGQTMALVDRATNVLSRLDLEVGDRPIFFIVHSMGGLLVKQMLRHAWDLGNPHWKAIAQQTKGIIYLSTPHSGSDVANWVSYIGTLLQASVSLEELKAHDPRLRELNQVYRNHDFLSKIPIKVYFETRKTKGVLVVNETSADPGIQGVIPIPMDDDHISICRPKSKQSILYERTKRFIKDRVEVESDREKKKIPQNIPHSGVATFVGRSQELENLHEQLQQGDRVAISAIVGMVGVGKTELARQYAHYYKEYYQGGVCWLPSRDVGSGVVDFALEKFEIHPPDKLLLENRVHYCWDNWPIQGDILVILDDVTDYNQIKLFLPPDNPRFKVIITTRLQTLDRDLKKFKKLDLRILKEGAALELLQSLIDKYRVVAEVETARELCQWLGYLPLGLKLVGQYLLELEDLSFTDMKVRLEQQQNLDFVEDTIEATDRGVKAAFQLSWQALNTVTQELAIQLSLFAAAPIPWKIVEQYKVDIDSILLDNWRTKLVKLSLLQRESENMYQLHPLFQKFLISQSLGFSKIDQWRKEYCHVIASICRDISESTTLNYQQYRICLPHILECIDRQSEYLRDQERENIYNTLGCIYRDRGDYKQAISFHQKSLKIRKKEFGSKHPKVAESLNNLGLAVKLLGKYDGAKSLYKKSLEIREEILDDNHPDIGESCNNLAMLYTSKGKYSEAYKLYKRALKIRNKVFGEKHPKTITTLDNYAYCYYEDKNYVKAESLYTRLRLIARGVLGEIHPDYLRILNNLSQVYSKQGKHEQAKTLMEECIKTQKKIWTGDHPTVAMTLNNLGAIYYDLKEFENAESFYQKSLDMRKRMFGNKHPDVVASLNNLAKLYQVTKRFTESEKLYTKALNIAESILGIEHPWTKHIRSSMEHHKSSSQENQNSQS